MTDAAIDVRPFPSGRQPFVLPKVAREARPSRIPLSYAQSRWLNLERIPNQFNRVALLAELTGRLNVSAMRKAVTRVVQRHEALRTSYYNEGQTYHQIVRPCEEFDLKFQDLKHLASESRERAVWEALHDEINAPARLDGDALSLTLFDVGENRWFLGGFVYHIGFDDASAGIFWPEIFMAYRHNVLGLAGGPAPPFQYVDYALWEKRWLTPERLRASEDFWHEYLSGASPLFMPNARESDSPPSPIGVLRFSLEEREVEHLRDRARRHRATANILMLAAVSAAAAKLAGSARPLIGTVTNSRTSGFESTIGCFVQQRAICVDFSDDPDFSTVVGRTRAAAIETSDIRRPPPANLMASLEAGRIFVNYIAATGSSKPGAAPKALVLGLKESITSLPWRIQDQISSDVRISVRQSATELNGFVFYAADRFTETWISAMLDSIKKSLLVEC